MSRTASTRQMDTVTISEFKARCLALVAQVKRTGRPLRVTRRGEPMADVVPPEPPPAPASWLGSGASTGRIVGDLVAPAFESDEWEAIGVSRKSGRTRHPR